MTAKISTVYSKNLFLTHIKYQSDILDQLRTLLYKWFRSAVFFYLVSLPSSTHGFQSHPVCGLPAGRVGRESILWGEAGTLGGYVPVPEVVHVTSPSFHWAESAFSQNQLHVRLIMQSGCVLRRKRRWLLWKASRHLWQPPKPSVVCHCFILGLWP